jgi:hypothetical protein
MDYQNLEMKIPPEISDYRESSDFVVKSINSIIEAAIREEKTRL